MLAAIDEAFEALLRATAPLSAVDIDVTFEQPDEEWVAKLTRPTVNAYLWDVRRSSDRAVTGTEVAMRDNVPVRRLALPRVDLHYFVSVWTSEHDDERALLGSLLLALLRNREIGADYLPGPLHGLPLPVVHVARTGDADTFRLDRRLKLGLQVTITAVADTGAGTPLAAPVTEIGVTLSDMSNGATATLPKRVAGECHDPAAIGARVTSPRGSTTVNASGRFLISAAPGDEITLDIDPAHTVVAPASGGVVFPLRDAAES
ncbi:MAG TPA: Pvc16 family protein [Ilumatobacteraceae bacterium]|nr:Pvc16 family protein [Ilumatobacteraceae bacterium]